jgi:hypothetical protein
MYTNTFVCMYLYHCFHIQIYMYAFIDIIVFIDVKRILVRYDRYRELGLDRLTHGYIKENEGFYIYKYICIQSMYIYHCSHTRQTRIDM